MKTVLISGASEGLGKAIAQTFSSDPNYKVIIFSTDQVKIAQTGANLNCDYYTCDVTNYSSLELMLNEIVAKYQKIDVVVNNAGLWIEGNLETNDPLKIKSVIDVNTLGVIYLTRAVLPLMKNNSGGQIINIVSQAGLTSKAQRSVYNASKWAITGFTKSLQEELVGTGVKVTGIYPSLINTKLFEKAGVNKDMSKALDPNEIAKLVKITCELPDNTYIPDLGIKNTGY